MRFKNYLLQCKLRKTQKYFDFSNLETAKNTVFVIDSIIPEFDKDSGSRRLYNIIKLMIKNNFFVVLMSDKKEYKYNASYVKHYRDMGVIVYEPSLDENSKLINRESFVKRVSLFVDYAWLHRPTIFYKYHRFFQRNSTKIIFDMVDFHYLRHRREWEKTAHPRAKKMADKFLKIEIDNCINSDCIIAISQQDKKELLAHYSEEKKIKAIGNIHHFKDNSGPSFKERSGLLFVGGFDHKPNIDAVNYLHNTIMPVVWQHHPEIEITIAGSNPTCEILAMKSEKFKVLGYVEDLTTLFQSAKLFVAPLRFGAGVKGKIGQSLEFGLPVVTTSVGAEGFDFSPFEKNIISNHTQQFVENLRALYFKEVLWKKIHLNSKKTLDPFSVHLIEKNILEVLKPD